MERKIALMNAYDEHMGLVTNVDSRTLFGYMTYRMNEFRHQGSLRSFLNTQYAILNIRKFYGLNLLEWLNQPMINIYQQMIDIPEILRIQEEAAKLNDTPT